MAKARNGSTRRHRQWATRVLRGATTCALCGQPLDTSLTFPHPMSPEADHITPWSQAPHLRYDVRNGQPAHRICNLRKGARSAAPQRPAPSIDW